MGDEGVLLLDLDSVDPDKGSRPAPGRLRDVRAPLWVVVLAALSGAVVAVALTRAWDADRARRGQQETVRLLVALPSDVGLSGGGNSEAAAFQGDLQVTNTGPLAIELGRVTGGSAAITVSGDAEDLNVPVDDARGVGVRLRVDCSRWEPNDPLEMTVGVTTLDGVHRSKLAYLVIGGTGWGNQIQRVCSTPAWSIS
jgi:hypothetical protein